MTFQKIKLISITYVTKYCSSEKKVKVLKIALLGPNLGNENRANMVHTQSYEYLNLNFGKRL